MQKIKKKKKGPHDDDAPSRNTQLAHHNIIQIPRCCRGAFAFGDRCDVNRS